MPGRTPISGFLDFIYESYKAMSDHEISLAYEGEINHRIIKKFTSQAEENMQQAGESKALQLKIYHVLVECLQNISKHAVHPEDEFDSEYNQGIFLLIKNQEVYNITTGNFIKLDRIDYLTELLIYMNSLTRKQLDDLYKKQMREGHLSEKGGAGLGFIDLRRKTGKELEYQFLPFSDTHAFFLFNSTIPRNK